MRTKQILTSLKRRFWSMGTMLSLLLAIAPRCDGQSIEDSTADHAFPQIYNSEPDPSNLLSPQQALDQLHLPAGFEATLFAAEPDVQNPIAACVDPRGRVWVAENYTYAERAMRFDLSLNDRIVVLQDDDGDGVSDRRVVFSDTLKMLTGITVGRGGVWAMCPPQLLFIPDADGDLVPDGPPQVKLDGFHVATENYHNFANGLSWGPDNWLYGRCGASCPGEMGLPGSADDSRVPIRGGMWRYHPERKVAEALTQGTTNPWGHDWNSVGELFFINTVNGHLWHAIPGAHFVRPHTLDSNPYCYELIDMHADHWHFDTGKSWTDSRAGAANDYGGGHAHVGMMIYQEDTWPEDYQGTLFTVNMHGRRINQEILERHGSGYVGRHGDDFLLSGDLWFRGMEIMPTPDGNVLLIDWSDTGECHDSTGVHRTSGRIFKISHGSATPHWNALAEPSTRGSPLELARLQASGSNWESRRARELLAELALHDDVDLSQAVKHLQAMLQTHSDTHSTTRLRALWALVATGTLDAQQVIGLLDDRDEYLRCWGIRLLTDNWPTDLSTGGRPVGAEVASRADIERLVRLAQREESAAVRLTLASVLQRMPLDRRLDLARPLMSRQGDAHDHNLPLMVWYGLMPLGDRHVAALVEAVNVCRWPITARLCARRVFDSIDDGQNADRDRLVQLTLDKEPELQQAVVAGIAQALAGRRKATQPKGWDALRLALQGVDDSNFQSSLQNLSILFGDGRTVDELVQLAADDQVDLELRMAALQTLVDSRAEGIEQLCLQLLGIRFLNSVAAAGLAQQTAPAVGQALVKNYRRFHPSERSPVISILAARPAWARALLMEVARGSIDRSEISAFQARQIANHHDEELDQLLLEQWGQARASSADKRELIERLQASLTADELAKGDKSQGRALFQKSCASCHKLFGEGGALGPDLTGAQRSNLGYLLENIIDPSAVVTKEFRATVLLLEDGRALTGLLTNQTESSLSLATQENTFQIPLEDVVQHKLSESSTMPDGVLTQMSPEQIRDLFAYLQSTEQVAAAAP